MCVFYISGGAITQEDAFYFSRNPSDVTAIAGDRVKLECEASVPAGLTYYWQQDGAPVTNTTRRYQNDGDLIIRRVHPQDDSGQFTCIATNATTGFSLASRTATVDVHCE